MIFGLAIRLLSRSWSAFDRAAVRFAIWWRTHDVRGVAAGQKLLSHPKKGSLGFEYASFQANDDSALKLVIYTPV